MKIDWHSQSTEVFLNPRIERKEREQYKELLQRGNKNLPGHLWFATSGTSGRFKFVALSKEAILCSAKAVNNHFESSSNDTWINVLPTFHVGGVGIFARSYVSGAKVLNIYSEKKRWDPQEFIGTAIEAHATLSALLPTQVHDIVKLKVRAPESLRAVVVGGGVLDNSLYQKAQSLGWNLFPSYGLTECSSQVATALKGETTRYKILDHLQVRIDDDGYINLKSTSLLSSYAFVVKGGISFEDPKENGFFRTEDIGELEGNFLKVHGRDSDFLKISGESVSLPAVQRNLDKMKMDLGVHEEMVLFPQNDDRLGQVIALCIEGRISQKVKTLIDQHNERVLPYERIHHVYSADKIPRNHMGKPEREKLVEHIT